MDWRRFLTLACCPQCQTSLRTGPDGLICAEEHCYPLDEGRIPLFDPPAAPPSARRRLQNEEDAAAYAGMRAFAAEALGRGDSEGLYRCVSALLLRALRGRQARWLLDLGCGSGRTVADAATAFPAALVVGVDRSAEALLIAYAATCLSGRAVGVDLRRWGFGSRSFAGRGRANVFLAQAAVERLPFVPRSSWTGFDAVTCVNLLDRAKEPTVLLDRAAALVAPGGALLLTTPLNWQQEGGEFWRALGSLAGLCAELVERGLKIETAFDGLAYREVHDVRGSATDWRVAVVQARRPA
jgi:SAM-dependent methyltransferase